MRPVTARDLYARLDEADRYGHGSIHVTVNVFSEGHGIRLRGRWQTLTVERTVPWSQIELTHYNVLIDEIDLVRDMLLRNTQDRE